MRLNVKGWALLTYLVIVLTISVNNLFAAEDDKKPKVRSTNYKDETENNFKTNESVYAEGRNFKKLSNVDIYVTENKKWEKGDILTGTDISSDGVETVQTTSKGSIPKTSVWGAPTVVGSYDIIVDANQDGTFNANDAVDGKSADPGFKVKRFLP